MNDELLRKPDVFWASMEAFTRRLNEAPPKEWIQKHNGFDYIPVGIIETELHKIFSGLVKYSIANTETIGTAARLTARISVFHPVALEWFEYDGIATDVTDVIAYAEAKKTAAKQIGKRFGADLNRKDFGDYDPIPKSGDFKPIEKVKNTSKVTEALKTRIVKCKTAAALTKIYSAHKPLHTNTEFIKLFMVAKTALNKPKNGK